MEIVVEKEPYYSWTPRYLLVDINGNVSSTPKKHPAIDYTDVYGGPPTRAPFLEARLGLDDECEGAMGNGTEKNADCKPVFGFSGPNTPRYVGENFFDDIFRVKDSIVSCSPRKQEADSLHLWATGDEPRTPRPLVAGNDKHFGDWSRGARNRELKETERLGPGSGPCEPQNNDAGLPVYSSSSSRFPRQTSQMKEMTEKHLRCKSYFSKESASRGLDSPCWEKTEDHEKGNKLERRDPASDSDPLDAQGKNTKFHFSMYKWANQGVPVSMLRRTREDVGMKDKGKIARCSSFTGWLHGENFRKGLCRTNSRDKELCASNSGSSSSLCNSKDLVKDPENSFFDAVFGGSEEQIHTIRDEPFSTVDLETAEQINERKEFRPKLHPGLSQFASDSSAGEEEIIRAKQPSETHNSNDTVTNKHESKRSKVRSSQKSVASGNDGELKKGCTKTSSAFDGYSGTADTRCSTNYLRSSGGKSKCGEKVKEFVKIFNQNAANKEELSVKTERRNPCSKETDRIRASDVMKDTLYSERSGTGSRKVADSSMLVSQYVSKSEKPKSDSRQSESKSFSSATNMASEDNADYNNCFFMVEELPLELVLPREENGNEQEEMQAIDDKVRRWCSGKENNIRSLLSTLQYVLWPGSGWKAVPLVDIIEGNAVKKAYQRALLCLHPDKLQQKGAMSREKIVAEKVFDVLQDAWTYFNSLSSV